MATQTRVEGEWGHPSGGQVVLSYDWDDALLRLLRVVMTSTIPVDASQPNTGRIDARRANGTGQAYFLECSPGQTVEQNIPGNTATRLGVTVTPSGKLDGVAWSFRFVAG